MASQLMHESRRVQALGMIGWLLLCFAVAAFGGMFAPGEWYAGLERPAWTPPDWLFAPVSTLLYVMMAIAAWQVWRLTGFREGKAPLSAFIVQLLMNGLWSAIFFGLQAPGLALIWILLLWLAIGVTLFLFSRVSWSASALLLPYLLWVSFAAVLNAAFWWLN